MKIVPLLFFVMLFVSCKKEPINTKKYSAPKPVAPKEQREVPKADAFFKKKLEELEKAGPYEEDSEFGYIKTGDFLDNRTKNAIVISFDTRTTFSVYELKGNNWQKVFSQQEDFARFNGIEAFIDDYDFDGRKDIGIKNEVSNGTAIMTFHLWLSTENGFHYVEEFREIGNPQLLPKERTVRGFAACCVFTEITLTDYSWRNDQLVKTHTLEIGNYPYGISATSKDEPNGKACKILMSKKKINALVDEYGLNWQLRDQK